MPRRHPSRRPAFTLVEMLVVIGIIVVLVALLVPVASVAVSTSRNFNMTADITQISQAIESYKKEKGDYPPSMGELDLLDADGDGVIVESLYQVAPFTSVCERHLRKCYPKMTNTEKQVFYRDLAPQMGQAEALWFWLSQTQNDERQPFFSTARNYKKYFDFKPERVAYIKDVQLDLDNDGTPETQFTLNGYKPGFARETAFIYLDARTYVHHSLGSSSANTAANLVAQPYGDFVNAQKVKQMPAPANQAEIMRRKQMQYMNPTTFQILCAGQDGEWGPVSDQFDSQGYPIEISGTPNLGLRQFREGIGYNDEDKDNLTNFGEGRRLVDHIPQ